MVSLQFYGVRGSHPVADAKMARYGGNTPCVVLLKTNRAGLKVPVILDAGSGLIPLGYCMASKFFTHEYSQIFSIMFTHLHPDHTEGFNFFTPNFFSFCTIYLMGMQTLKRHVGIILKEKMVPPTFPIEYKDLKSNKEHRILHDGQVFHIDQNGRPSAKTDQPLFIIHVMQAFAPSHPQQGALYYKIVDPDDNTAIVCVWDIESHIGGDVRVINFAQGADVLIHDTMYTDEEYVNPKTPVQGFGHSTYSMAIENAEKSGVKYLIPFHYNPRHNDDFLDAVRKKYQNKHAFSFIMSYEGLELTFDKGNIIRQADVKQGFSP
ncbi:MAG: hypothetical protein LBD37_07485 [Treponema sp.]|nr:hypothetical protein [Treponema sp.]